MAALNVGWTILSVITLPQLQITLQLTKLVLDYIVDVAFLKYALSILLVSLAVGMIEAMLQGGAGPQVLLFSHEKVLLSLSLGLGCPRLALLRLQLGCRRVPRGRLRC
jgi:hypothetical protein